MNSLHALLLTSSLLQLPTVPSLPFARPWVVSTCTHSSHLKKKSGRFTQQVHYRRIIFFAISIAVSVSTKKKYSRRSHKYVEQLTMTAISVFLFSIHSPQKNIRELSNLSSSNDANGCLKILNKPTDSR